MCGTDADGWIVSGLALLKSRLLRARGEMRGALQFLAEAAARPSRSSVPAWLTQANKLDQARILIATGRPDAAVALLRDERRPHHHHDVDVVLAAGLHAGGDTMGARHKVTPIAAAVGVPPPVAVEAWLLLATIAADDRDEKAAHSALRRALRLATPETQRRAFHEVATPLRRILRDDASLAGHYRTLLGDIGHGVRQQPGVTTRPRGDVILVETLSKREMEVLTRMAAMLPTEEIAAGMYVSINTVKTHVRNILRKLSASRRNEAIRRARALGLI
jgi:LuxR family maltose regulon positive regulatory protein